MKLAFGFLPGASCTRAFLPTGPDAANGGNPAAAHQGGIAASIWPRLRGPGRKKQK